MKKHLLASGVCALAVTMTLSGCGGDGGSVGSIPAPPSTQTTPPPPPPSPPPATTTNYDTQEYHNSNYATAASAISAYNAGYTGRGIKIGIVDSGINPKLSEFTGKIDPASGDVAGSRGVSDEGGHGTAVSAVAAAARNGSNTMGVAFDATIVSERADDPGSCAAKDGCQFYDSAIASGIDAARQAGARVINLSLGGSQPGSALLSAMQRAVNAGIVLVISAGNDGEDPSKGTNPDSFALTPAQRFPGQVIIAGSIGDDNGSGGTNTNVISSFSNRAGTGAQYYLMALGYMDRAPDQTGKQYLWSGTSFSAPTISGAVALMAQAFPNLTGKQIVSLLFQSADDLGAAGVDTTYGHGRLNLAKAFEPKGTTSFAQTDVAVSTTSNGELPAVAGDANTSNSFGAVILDGYKRAYAINLARTLSRAPQERPLSRALQGDMRTSTTSAGPLSVAMTVSERHDLAQGFELERLGIGPQDARTAHLVAGAAIARLDETTAVAFGFSQSARSLEKRLNGAESGAFLIAKDVAGEPGFATMRSNSLAVRHQFGGTGVTFAAESGDVWRDLPTSNFGSPYRYVTASVDRQIGRNRVAVGLGRLQESNTLLGGYTSSPLGGGGSGTSFLDLEARHDFGGGWNTGLTARRGWTSFSGGSFETGAYGLDLTKTGLFGNGDQIGLRIAQPLRVEHGGFAMLLPTTYDYTTETAGSSISRFSLTPNGREVDAELSYGLGVFGDTGWLGGNLYVRRQPGHIADAPNDVGGAVRLSFRF